MGVWAIAAATAGLRAATSRTWPPLAEKPQTARRSGSTSGNPRAREIAASQSAELIADWQDLSRLAAALACAPVVECQDGEAGVVKGGSKEVCTRLLRHRKAAGHDDAGSVRPGIVPGRAFGVAARESDLHSLWRHVADLPLMFRHRPSEPYGSHSRQPGAGGPKDRPGQPLVASSRSSARQRASSPASVPSSPLSEASRLTRNPRRVPRIISDTPSLRRADQSPGQSERSTSR